MLKRMYNGDNNLRVVSIRGIPVEKYDSAGLGQINY
jgi:hypothetical protein